MPGGRRRLRGTHKGPDQGRHRKASGSGEGLLDGGIILKPHHASDGLRDQNPRFLGGLFPWAALIPSRKPARPSPPCGKIPGTGGMERSGAWSWSKPPRKGICDWSGKHSSSCGARSFCTTAGIANALGLLYRIRSQTSRIPASPLPLSQESQTRSPRRNHWGGRSSAASHLG